MYNSPHEKKKFMYRWMGKICGMCDHGSGVNHWTFFFIYYFPYNALICPVQYKKTIYGTEMSDIWEIVWPIFGSGTVAIYDPQHCPYIPNTMPIYYGWAINWLQNVFLCGNSSSFLYKKFYNQIKEQRSAPRAKKPNQIWVAPSRSRHDSRLVFHSQLIPKSFEIHIVSVHCLQLARDAREPLRPRRVRALVYVLEWVTSARGYHTGDPIELMPVPRRRRRGRGRHPGRVAM